MRSRPICAAVVAAYCATFAANTSVKAADINLMTTGAVELLPIQGIDIVGELPREIQTTLVYATGIHADTRVPDAAKALSSFLQLETSVAAIRKNGMVPAPR